MPPACKDQLDHKVRQDLTAAMALTVIRASPDHRVLKVRLARQVQLARTA